MIVTLFVIVYLAWQTYKGYRIGFTRRIVNLILAAIVFTVAILGQNSFGSWLMLQFGTQASTHSTTLDLMLYRFAAFFIIMFAGRMISKLFKSWLPVRKNKKSFTGLLDSALGAVISLIAAYFFMYVVLSMLNALQNAWFIQQTLDSPVLHFIIYSTPGLSNDVFNNIFGISRTLA